MTLVLYDLCGRDPDLRFSPFCWRVKMALAHKGLAVETIATPFTEIGSIKSGETSTVPVLDDDGTLMSGSFDIALHLDERYADRPPLFEGPADRSMGRFLDSWAARTLHPIIVQMIVKDIHDALGDADQTYFRESRETRFGKPLEEAQLGVDALAESLASALAPLRSSLKHAEWLGGNAPGFADYIIVAPLMWLYTISGRMPFQDGDPVADWFRRSLELHDGFAGSAKRAA